MTSIFSPVERNSIAVCCALSLLLFFVPLLTIHVPIAGDQEVSGYDVFSKLNGMRDNLRSSEVHGQSETPSSVPENLNEPSRPTPDLPLTVQTAWLIPIAITVAFLCGAVALVGAFTNSKVTRGASIVGACSSAFAILHITIMNSDMHSWLANSMKSQNADLKDNPFAGLAEGMGNLIANAFQLKPGWGLYALVLLLGVIAVLGFSRVLSRVQLAPSSKV